MDILLSKLFTLLKLIGFSNVLDGKSVLAVIYSRVRPAAIWERRPQSLPWRPLHSLLADAPASTAIGASLGGGSQGARAQSPVLQGGHTQARGVWLFPNAWGSVHILSTHVLSESLRMNMWKYSWDWLWNTGF